MTMLRKVLTFQQPVHNYCQNNYVGLKYINNAAKNVDIQVTSLNVLYNHFDDPNKIIFICI